jgi:DNA-binding NtrC family response regulator
MMVRADSEHVSAWLEQVQRALRPIDRAALYSNDTIEVLLPEVTTAQVTEIANRIVAQAPAALSCGVASFPESATQSDGLLEACRRALSRGTGAVGAAEATTVVLSDRVTARQEDLVAESPSMKQLLTMARRVARGVIPVLLHGETGSGKEVASRFIHEQGPRKDHPLVAVNCAAIPPQLVESTLFGHEKGAFTGATQAHKGVFEAAHGGTVLLDEIGELPAAAQAALLRVLELKKVMRVGSTKEIEVDVRIMAATHRNLEEMCKEGTFREDLLYRLNALSLDIPPLRERREDIVALAQRFLEQAAKANGREPLRFEPSALEALTRYGWPGNVRELRNAIERAVVIAEHDVVTLPDMPRGVRDARNPSIEDAAEAPVGEEEASAAPAEPRTAPLWQRGESFRACIERLEAEVLVLALKSAGGSQTDAARVLDLPRRTLVHKMKVLGIKRLGYGVDE